MKKAMIKYSSSLNVLDELNGSFDRGVLKVAYWGRNRNRSYISKDSFERAIKSIYNCPIVCNYDREDNSIGGHDVEIVTNDDGDMKLVNVTQPVGVVPESADYWWETVQEDDGASHEYLCVDILIWKRQEAYQKIKNNKITDESMEIDIHSGYTDEEGFYHIEDFEFTAFCLLEDVEPCFESASVELFSLNTFKREFSKMMQEFKETYDDSENKNKNTLKGGSDVMDYENIFKEYGIKPDDVDFDYSLMTKEEITNKLDELFANKKADDSDDDPDEGKNIEDKDKDVSEPNSQEEGKSENPEGEKGEPVDDGVSNEPDGSADEPDDVSDTYSLSVSDLTDGIYEALGKVTYEDPYWGECKKYWYVDCDIDDKQIYCYDDEDWHLYGFNFEMNGDLVEIDFNSKKRKKYKIVDFDEGSVQGAEFSQNMISRFNAIKTDFEKISKESKILSDEVNELKEYKTAKEEDAITDVLSGFSELFGDSDFEKLKENHEQMTAQEIEEKCYALLGKKQHQTKKFSIQKDKPTRIGVPKNNYSDEPYGGLFVEYNHN